MADLDIRLNRIEKSCLETARKDLKNLKDENYDYIVEKKTDAIDDYKDELARLYKQDVENLNKDFNREVFEYEVEKRKDLNEYKEKLINNIFLKLKDEMVKFVSSRGYKKYLMKTIEKIIGSEKGDFVIYITPHDYSKYKKDIEKLFDVETSKIEEDIIGGCIVLDRKNKISIDNTILTNIKEEVMNINL